MKELTHSRNTPIISAALFLQTLFFLGRRILNVFFWAHTHTHTHQCRTEPCNTTRAISLFGGEKGVVISMSPVQEQQSLPSNAVLCNINQDWWVVMELQQPSEKGRPSDGWGERSANNPTDSQKYTNTLPPACVQVMLMSYERYGRSAHNTSADTEQME